MSPLKLALIFVITLSVSCGNSDADFKISINDNNNSNSNSNNEKPDTSGTGDNSAPPEEVISEVISPRTGLIMTWKTDNTGFSAANQITLLLESGGTYNFEVYWGDGTSDTNTAWDQTEVTQWGNVQLSNVTNMFEGCTNLAISASDAPDFSVATNLMAMFRDAKI